MRRLAVEFGLSSNGLAKVCDRLHVPYPPRGYWARKEAGKPVETIPLPSAPPGTPASAIVRRPPARVPTPAETEARHTAAALPPMAIPATLADGLHPRVRAWVAEHKRLQQERDQERRRHRRDSWGSPRPPIIDLTARDQYRFRVTSALLASIENVGGRITKAELPGKLAFTIAGETVEFTLAEKMVRPLRPPEGEAAAWTAFPAHHQTGLFTSGFLRAEITTYLGGGGHERRWVETTAQPMAKLLPSIVGAVMAAGPALVTLRQEHEERERAWKRERAERFERQRLEELDAKRWERFRARAADWEESRLLARFLDALRADSVADDQFGDWMAWAQARVEAIDPMRQPLADLIAGIAGSGDPPLTL